MSGIVDVQRHSADWWWFAGRWGRGAQGVTAQGSGLSFRSGGNTLKLIAQLYECSTDQIEHETDELYGM